MATSNPRADVDLLAINTLRMLAADAVQEAESGHPGLPMGAAPMAYTLWSRHLRLDPHEPEWVNRDRFVLSAGHGSMLLYGLLHLFGFDLSLDDLRAFRQWGSKTPGHPEFGHTPGVETTTGPLGQGFGNAVGMALAEAHLAARFNRDGYAVVDHHTYAIASDGDLMEGVQAEAASLAGHLGLGKLIVLYDDNGITIDGSTSLSFGEDVPARFGAYGWHVLTVEDGNDVEAIDEAIAAAKAEGERPSLVSVRTQIGFGSPNKQGSSSAHGEPLGEDELRRTKENLGWPLEPTFYVPDIVRERCSVVADTGAESRRRWEDGFAGYAEEWPDLATEWTRRAAAELPEGWDADLPSWSTDEGKIATRKASGAVLTALASRVPEIVGGSADLTPSNKTQIDGSGDLLPGAYGERNIRFGIREHAMGAMLNGMCLHGGLVPYGATFLIFSDYLRPSIRLAALMGLPVIYVFTHDSIGVGEDGPTHQPIEQTASLRTVPNLRVFRPSDANETREAWRIALADRTGPVALVLTRQGLPVLDVAETVIAEGVRRGGYVLADAPGDGDPEVLLIASGSEVALAVGVHERLLAEGTRSRVVAMPCAKLFEQQDRDYRDSVLPAATTVRVAIEAGETSGWWRYVGIGGDVVGIDRFGASAPGAVNMEKFGFTVDNVLSRVRLLR